MCVQDKNTKPPYVLYAFSLSIDQDIKISIKLGCNWVALSYIQNDKPVLEARKLIKEDKEKFAQAKLKIKEFKAKEAKEKNLPKGNKKNPKKYSNLVRIVVEE
jgi:pyruvate kinase